jgi:hypothetical protein
MVGLGVAMFLGASAAPAFAESAPPPTPVNPNEQSDISFESSVDLALSVFLIVGVVGGLYVFVEKARRERRLAAANATAPAARAARHRRPSTRPPQRPTAPRVTTAQVEASTKGLAATPNGSTVDRSVQIQGGASDLRE